ncbi:MAG: hypothetical protein PHG67_11510 [Bacteroidales bacterium]|nr:hypothetical protein [Bacteroidales bacterium]
MNTLKVLSLMLLLAIWQPLRAQEAPTTIRQSEENQELILSPDNSSIRETYWKPSTVENGIFYKGLVGINTTTPAHELHVLGSAYVSSLNINGQYNLPTTRATAGHYLNGLGEWTPMSIGGGTGFWQGLTGNKGIFYNDGLVGINIGEDMPRYQLHVNGSVGVRSLEIIGEYALPEKRGNADQFLNGLGQWETISSGGGGENFWQPVGINDGIYYTLGRVGIGTTAPGANLHVQGNMKMGCNIGEVGTNAFAGGDGSTASGTNAFAFGENSNASGTDAVSIGFWSEATSDKSFSLGFYNQSNTAFSYLFGQWLKSTISSNITIGFGAGQSPLVNNKHRSLMMGMNSNFPTIYIGPSDGIGTTGSIGIGNMTDPQAKLHMLSDEDEAATLKLEHRTTGTKRYAEIGLGTHRIRAGNTENMVFKTPSSRHFVFENGNVGIGVSNPSKKLEVAGDIEFSGDLYSNGQLFTSSNWTVNGESIYRSTGNVGIGTSDPQAALDVQGNSKFRGNLYVEEVIVEEATNWPDYVFEADYKLMSLSDLKSFITANKHLPDMPKADENGELQQIKLAEMNALLLKKIEELTLYMLEQEERINSLERQFE